MTRNTALKLVMDAAMNYAENVDDGFVERVTAETSNEDCYSIAYRSNYEPADVMEIRNVFAAVEAIRSWMSETTG